MKEYNYIYARKIKSKGKVEMFLDIINKNRKLIRIAMKNKSLPHIA